MVSCVNLEPAIDLSREYTLPVIRYQKTEADSERKSLPAIYVNRPSLPAYLDSNRFVVLHKNGELKQLPNAYWAEPRSEAMARNLAQHLETPETYRATAYPAKGKSNSEFELTIAVKSINPAADGLFQIDIDWAIQRDATTIHGVFRSHDLTWDGTRPDSYLTTLDTALKQCAEHILGEIEAL